MGYQGAEFLTTKELAELLRIKERRVYDLAASGDVPCSRATGKLLFPRKAIDQWLVENGSGFSQLRHQDRPSVIVGSHDPLLEWALRASGSGLASLFDCSDDGLARFKKGEALAAGLHLYEVKEQSWNVTFVADDAELRRAVLVEWARRDRGFIVAKGNPENIKSFEDLRAKKIVPRQAGAGAAYLFEELVSEAGVKLSPKNLLSPQRSELDAALVVAEGKADVAFGLRAFAEQLHLGFVPLLEERYDLLVCRKAWFDEPLQTLMAFSKEKQFSEKAADMKGYDISGQWTVRYNGA